MSMSAGTGVRSYSCSMVKKRLSTIFQFKQLDRRFSTLHAPRINKPREIITRIIKVRTIFFFSQNYPAADVSPIELKLLRLVRRGAIDLINGLCSVGHM